MLVTDSGVYVLADRNWTQSCTTNCSRSGASIATNGPSLIAVEGTTTYAWSGTGWTTACANCTTGSSSALAYGGASGTVVRLGGIGANSQTLSRYRPNAWASEGGEALSQGNVESSGLVYDPDGNAYYSLGGTTYAGSGRSNPRVQGLIEGRNGAWTEVVPASTSVTAPTALRATAIAYDEARGAHVVVSSDAGQQRGTWQFQSGARTRPAQLFTVDLSGVPADTRVDSINVTWHAIASSDGVDLYIWSVDQWEEIAANVIVPGQLELRVTDAQRFVVGKHVTFAAAPNGLNGATRASVSTDYVEATFVLGAP